VFLFSIHAFKKMMYLANEKSRVV